MAPSEHPGPAVAVRQGAVSRQAATVARRAALFASGLQRSDAPTAAMAAKAIKAVRRFGIQGCISRMAQEFGDHPGEAAERMRWICQLAAEMPAQPHIVAAADGENNTVSHQMEAVSNHYRSSGWNRSAARPPRTPITAGGTT
jgi:hypothetical protein